MTITKSAELTAQEEKLLYFVKSNANKQLSRDITIDMLSYLVAYKLMNNSSNKKRPTRWLSIIFIILTIISILMGYFLANPMVDKNEIYKVVNDPSIFANINYFGKNEVIQTMIARITRMIGLIDKKDSKLLNCKITPAKKNYLFYGEPGTGKTHLIKKLSYLLDINLKFYYLKKKKIKIEGKNKKEILQILKETKPQVRLISIQPSLLNDKYVGGTEKKIQNLWAFAEDKKDFALTIIFMDEIDSFFSKRKEENTEHSTNVKSEFLCILDGIRSKLSVPIIFIGATNLQNSLDDAFLRRFHTKIRFSKPTPSERKSLIESFLCYNEHQMSDSDIQNLVELSDGLSQSQISRIFSDAADLSDTLTYHADLEDFQNLLANIKNAGTNQEQELAENNISMRGTEENYVFYEQLGV